MLVDETFIVTKIEIGLCTIIGDKYFAMLVRRHRARINVDVGVEFLHRDPQAATFEEAPDRCDGDAFPDR